MKQLPRNTSFALALCGLSSLFVACSSSKNDATPAGSAGASGSQGGGGGAGGGAGTMATGTIGGATTCAKSQIDLVFKPMYTAFDGTHTFQVPVVVDGVDATAIVWSASDKSMVDLAPDPSTGGALITARKAGTVQIIATAAGGLCGTSTLNITAATADDWAAGSARYNDGVVLRGLPRGNGGGARDGGATTDAAPATEAACTNCHGDTATMGPYKTVSHTPLQTAGFSDDDLKGIITKGMVPEGGYFDTMIVSEATWKGFHKWDMTDEELKGVVVYLRSLTPQKQTGARGDFGGRFNGDGGRPQGDGGRTQRDGGRQGDVAEAPDAAAQD